MRKGRRVIKNSGHGSTPTACLIRSALSAAIACALGLCTAANATNFTVSNSNDSGSGSLRQAVLNSNAVPGPNTISFALAPGSTITLTSGDIVFTGPTVTVQGLGRDTLTISGNHSSRIFDIQAGNVTLNDMTLRDGLAKGDGTSTEDSAGGAIRVGPPSMTTSTVSGAPIGLTLNRINALNNRAESPAYSIGGAVAASSGANLTVKNSVFDGNSTTYAGGALSTIGAAHVADGLVSAGVFYIADSSFTNNHIDQNGMTAGQGGALTSYGPGGTIARSVFRNNVINDSPAAQTFSEGEGGALNLLLGDAPINILDSEISGNVISLRPGAYSEGAALYCYGPTQLTISNTTISGNQSEYGAAIESGCNLQLNNSTIASNVSPNSNGTGDAIEMIQSGLFNADSSLIDNPDARVDLFLFTPTSQFGTVKKSLIFAPDATTPALPSGNIVGVNAMLGPLQNNGGPTKTQALLSGSVAIDAGENPQNLPSDQRGAGFARVVGAATDIGAFESNPDRIFANGFE